MTTTKPRVRRLMRPREAAAILGIHQSSVRSNLESGRLAGRKMKGRWRVLRSAVAKALAASPRWRKATVGGTFLAAYATPSGSVIALLRRGSGGAYFIVQRFPDGTMERFEMSSPEKAREHYEYALEAGVVAARFTEA